MSEDRTIITKTGRLSSKTLEKVSRVVRRLQQRIVKAVDTGDKRRANSLRRLLMRSYSLKLLAIHRVRGNKGGKTAGVDRFVIKDQSSFWEAFNRVKWNLDPKPLRRVYVPKKKWMKDRSRPLGIPTIDDRILQAMCLMAVEPIAEIIFHDNSYGFRPKRTTHDAIAAIFSKCNSSTYGEWILDADIEKCFDRINHKALLEKCKKYVRNQKIISVIKMHLKAGIIYQEAYEPTTQGTPQGGIFSPLLANIALDGIEACTTKAKVIRYADDLVAIGKTREDIEQTKEDIQRFLAKIGLNLSIQKTKIVNRREGFDFLGFNIRMRKPNWERIRDSICSNPRNYPTKADRRKAYEETKEKLIIKPADDNVKRIKNNIRRTVHGIGRRLTQKDLIIKLEPIINGWANYYSPACSKETFDKLDHWLWNCLWSWTHRRHPNKNVRWIKNRYFKKFRNRDRQFMTKDDKDTRRRWYILPRFADTRIVRHVKIRPGMNPYRFEDTEYFNNRDMDSAIKMFGTKKARIWGTKCHFCNQSLEWEKAFHIDGDIIIHHLVPLAAGGTTDSENCRVAHESCHIIAVHSLNQPKGYPLMDMTGLKPVS